MRDEFPAAVKRLLADRVGTRCSICGQATLGPTESPDDRVNVGVAAHITAASPDGPRYDQSLTREQRSSAENGIWCCQNHGKMVDDDPARYSAAELRRLKNEAEEAARREIEHPGSGRGTSPGDAPDLRLLLQGGQFWRYMKDARDWCIGPKMLVWLENASSIEANGAKFTAEVVHSPSERSDIGIWPHMGHIWGVCPAAPQSRVSLKALPAFTLGFEERWQAARVELIFVRPFIAPLKMKFTWGCSGFPHKKQELTAMPEAIESLFRRADSTAPGEKFATGAVGLRALFGLHPQDAGVLTDDYMP